MSSMLLSPMMTTKMTMKTINSSLLLGSSKPEKVEKKLLPFVDVHCFLVLLRAVTSALASPLITTEESK